METPIITALITSFAAIVSAFISRGITKRSFLKKEQLKENAEQEEYPSITQDRILAVQGNWHGWLGQDQYREDVKDVKIEIWPTTTVEGRIVKGLCHGEIHSPEKISFNLILDKGSFDGRYLSILFRNQDINAYHRGMLILELSQNGNSLSGKYLANGILKGDIVSGVVNVERV
jgi:hypothetical protein